LHATSVEQLGSQSKCGANSTRLGPTVTLTTGNDGEDKANDRPQ
jgi:hypothetical protein